MGGSTRFLLGVPTFKDGLGWKPLLSEEVYKRTATGFSTMGFSEVLPQAKKLLSGGKSPTIAPVPTAETIAAKEPDMDKLKRQRLAALMAGGRQGTVNPQKPLGGSSVIGG